MAVYKIGKQVIIGAPSKAAAIKMHKNAMKLKKAWPKGKMPKKQVLAKLLKSFK